MDQNSLLSDIERLRNLLHETAANFGIASIQTLRVSQQLDEKLNNYNRATHQSINVLAAKKSVSI